MEPYATAPESEPLNGSRSFINTGNSFLSKYKYWFIGGFILIMILLAVSIFTSIKKKRPRRRRPRRRRR